MIMALSITATYAIVFTASLMMFGVILGSMLYAYQEIRDGMNSRVDIIDSHSNTLIVERIVYNSGRIEIISTNKGPRTLNTDKLSILVNGTPVEFNPVDIWYPESEMTFFTNTTYYDVGSSHDIQFNIPVYGDVIATSELDGIYVLNSTSLISYDYSGDMRWIHSIKEPRDLSVGNYVFVLNSTGIFEFELTGTQHGFLPFAGLSSLDSRGSTLYAISTSKLYILNENGILTRTIPLSRGRDVAVGKEVYVLDGNTVRVYDYQGNYLGSINDGRLKYAVHISADWNSRGNYLFVLTSTGNILVYRNHTFYSAFALPVYATNIDVYGKIYLSSQGVYAMDMGYRIKIVDEFGNEIYSNL